MRHDKQMARIMYMMSFKLQNGFLLRNKRHHTHTHAVLHVALYVQCRDNLTDVAQNCRREAGQREGSHGHDLMHKRQKARAGCASRRWNSSRAFFGDGGAALPLHLSPRAKHCEPTRLPSLFLCSGGTGSCGRARAAAISCVGGPSGCAPLRSARPGHGCIASNLVDFRFGACVSLG
jgi:hypothetical protein